MSDVKQCDSYSTSAQSQCAYVDGHSGEHLFPHGGEDLSDQIRLKLLRDNRDALTARVAELEKERDCVERDTAERIAAWVTNEHPGFARIMLNIAADIRSGAWRGGSK